MTGQLLPNLLRRLTRDDSSVAALAGVTAVGEARAEAGCLRKAAVARSMASSFFSQDASAFTPLTSTRACVNTAFMPSCSHQKTIISRWQHTTRHEQDKATGATNT